MELCINHLTRMDPGYICVAGIGSAQQHVRPVLPEGQRLPRRLFADDGGPVQVGHFVEFGDMRHVPQAPETEDNEFVLDNVAHVRSADAGEFWELLQDCAQQSLSEIFGDELGQHGRGSALNRGHGSVSLGCLRTDNSLIDIYVDNYSKVKLDLKDPDFDLRLSVTDLRLWEANQKLGDVEKVAKLHRALKKSPEVILSVGVARPWQKPGDSEERHWLQINNVHLKTDSIGSFLS